MPARHLQPWQVRRTLAPISVCRPSSGAQPLDGRGLGGSLAPGSGAVLPVVYAPCDFSGLGQLPTNGSLLFNPLKDNVMPCGYLWEPHHLPPVPHRAGPAWCRFSGLEKMPDQLPTYSGWCWVLGSRLPFPLRPLHGWLTEPMG